MPFQNQNLHSLALQIQLANTFDLSKDHLDKFQSAADRHVEKSIQEKNKINCD